MADKASWVKVDPSSLPEGLRAKWAALAKASAAQKAAREEFEAAFLSASNKAKKIEAGKTLAFGYRFGGLAVAVIDKESTTTPAKSASAWF